jgi:hypothetical protein|tara:strand:- start:12715 stop:13335 length:621 start_codon:yes stop_codon:yes gene_type:complete
MSDNSTDAVPKHHYYDEKFLMMNRRADGVDERFDKLEDKMEIGFNRMFQLHNERTQSATKLGKEFYGAFGGILIIGISALWMVIGLLVNPIAESVKVITTTLDSTRSYVESSLPLMAYKTQKNREHIEDGLGVANRESIERHGAQEAKLVNLKKELDDLTAWRILSSEWKGEVKERMRGQRSDIDAQKEDLRIYTKEQQTLNLLNS